MSWMLLRSDSLVLWRRRCARVRVREGMGRFCVLYDHNVREQEDGI